MKVPNKVLNAIVKQVSTLPESEDKTLILAWAQEGLAKREALAAEAKASKEAES